MDPDPDDNEYLIRMGCRPRYRFEIQSVQDDPEDHDPAKTDSEVEFPELPDDVVTDLQNDFDSFEKTRFEGGDKDENQEPTTPKRRPSGMFSPTVNSREVPRASNSIPSPAFEGPTTRQTNVDPSQMVNNLRRGSGFPQQESQFQGGKGINLGGMTQNNRRTGAGIGTVTPNSAAADAGYYGDTRGQNSIEDQFFKKQMEFKGGKLHQLITDQIVNNNKIFANRYQNLIGVWYFIIDCCFHFENMLSLLLLTIIKINEFDMISIAFPIMALSVNITLMGIRNIVFEMRQRAVTHKINNKIIENLWITRTFKKYVPITWAECKPGAIIRVKNGQEFPADCLILDISGVVGQKCYVTSGPFDDSTGIIQKKSYSATSNKAGSTVHNEQHMSDMISGILKFEYNYFGYIFGSFKLSENPTAIDFDHENVVQRGALLTNTPQVTCLVLNVGDQCMGSVYKDPKMAMDSATSQKLKSFVKTQRSFDKAYKQSIRVFLLSLTIIYLVLSFLAIYLASMDNFFNISTFEQVVIENKEVNFMFYFSKGLGFFSILLSSIPLSFSNIIDLLVLMHTNFAEWDVNVTPADIDFIQPHATLAFGKVAHMFFSRRALQRDDKQAVKLFHVGGHFFKNQISQQMWDNLNENQSQMSKSNQQDFSANDEFLSIESNQDELSLEYLPNELRYTQQYQNEEFDQIMAGYDTDNKKMIIEFFRGLTLCHQVNVTKDLKQNINQLYQYLGVFNDEIATLEFAQKQGFKLIQRKNKMLTVLLKGNIEKYEELGVVTTKAVMGHFMTICATRLQGRQAGTLYMKGSIASLKHYFVTKENDFQFLNLFEQKFIQSGLIPVLYSKRELTIDETNQLIITINEGISQQKQNQKLDNLLYNLTSIQLEILGVLGVHRCVHLRNRVAVDDMILNGVKPWIVSKEDEQTHLTCLNSMRIFQQCPQPLIINGTRERVVMEQIQSALKIVTDRMATRGNEDDNENNFDNLENRTLTSISNTITKEGSKQSKRRGNPEERSKTNSKDDRGGDKNTERPNEEETNDERQRERSIIHFTGRAFQEITRDMTMQKAFMTLAYISDMMIGSEVSPIQKQKLLKIAKTYIGEGEYVAAIVTTPEDQFMVNEADLCANLKVKGKSADFQAVVDVTFKDFSAVSYLLFKHGNQIQMRISKASQAFYYRSLIAFLLLTSHMIQSGFSGQLPMTNFYYYTFMLLLAPSKILIYSTFYKDVGYEYLYRIYGHYKYNFSFSLVEYEYVFLDSICALFDWSIVYLPHEIIAFGKPVSLIESQNTSVNSFNCYQVLLMQTIFLYYFKMTNVQVSYSISFLTVLTLVGCGLIFDDENLIGVTQLFTTPCLILTLLWQILVLSLRNTVIDILSKLLIRRYADLHDWYADIEDRLSYEEYEDPEQSFSIAQFPSLYAKINSATIKNTLKLINFNMMKVPKTEQLEQILDKINTELDFTRRILTANNSHKFFKQSMTQVYHSNSHNNYRGGNIQLALTSGSINRWTLSLNDMNQETEYQENKNLREIVYVRRQMLVFVMTTFIFSMFGLILSITIDYTNLGVYYYIGLSIFTFIIYHILPKLTSYISNFLLFYTIVVIFCYTIYTSEDSSLQPTGLIFVLALVAGLNHSFIYPTVAIIMGSVLMHTFFSLMDDFENSMSNFNNTYRSVLWIFVGIIWSVYVYMQELEKKTSFVSGHKKVRYFQKLKQILNILVPSLVRDKIRSGKKNFSDDEGEVTVIFIDIHEFDNIVDTYKGQELLNLLDQVYFAFDQLCDQYGLQKIETVGKTYMACGGLKSAERKIESRLLNRHHSVRVTDFGIEVVNHSKNVFLKGGKNLEVKVGIHTGPVISGVVGDTKPQFSLIGDTINKTSRVCSLTSPMKASVSKETHHYLELYTNNLTYNGVVVNMKGIGQERIFHVGVLRGSQKVSSRSGAIMRGGMPISGDGPRQTGLNQRLDFEQGESNIENRQAMEAEKLQKQFKNKIEKYQGNVINDSESVGSWTERSHREDSHRELNYQQDQNIIQNQEDEYIEYDSQKSDQIDDGTMNVFGFNDDLNLDDRIIIKNATDNQIYQVVERPKYLLQFEQKDLEQDFLYVISKAESKKTTIFLGLLIVLNKVVILGDLLQDGGELNSTSQFISMFPIFVFELLLIYKLNNPNIQTVHWWTYMLLVYGIVILMVMMTFQLKYLGAWTRAGFNELQIQITLSLIFFMRNVMLRHFMTTYLFYFFAWLIILTIQAERFEYQIIQFIIGQNMYAALLAVGIHHREMIQRKSLNYERILNVEINKTNELIGKLVPYHMVTVIKNEKRHVDEFDDCTLLFTDMVKFTAFSKNVKDPREVVILLSKLFSRFDQVCEQNRVYKVHTIGDCYVIMGYEGRIEKSRRNHQVIIQEANRVVKTGLELIDIIAEVRNSSDNPGLKELDMRIGVHTGRVVAGIIGTKVVRYDIFGNGVLIANKMESNGLPGKLCISEDTKNLLQKSQDLAKQYTFTYHNTLELHKIGKKIPSWIVEKRTDSFVSDSSSSGDLSGSFSNATSSEAATESVDGEHQH